MNLNTESKANQQAENRAIRRFAFELFWSYRYRILLGLFLLTLARSAGFAIPYATKFLADDVFSHGNYALLTPIAIAVASIMLLQGIFDYINDRMIGETAQGLILSVRKMTHKHLLRLPISFFDHNPSGQLISRIMNDTTSLNSLVGGGMVRFLGSFITAIVAMTILLLLNWQLTLLVCAILIVFFYFLCTSFIRLQPIYNEQNRLLASVTGRLSEVFSGIRVFKSFNATAREERNFARKLNSLFRTIQHEIRIGSALGLGSTIAIGSIASAIILLGGSAHAEGAMSTGDLLLYILVVNILGESVGQLGFAGSDLSRTFAGLRRIQALRSQQQEWLAPAIDPRPETIAPTSGASLSFEQLCFEYIPGKLVLRNLNFSIEAGKTVAIVGSSGSGKSTLFNLLMGFYRPTSGRILIDQRDSLEIPLPELRSYFGFVLQDNILFEGTILDNLRLGNPKATLEQIEHICRLTHCHDFIATLPGEYDALVGERGITLSGGQCQRLSIARAMLANPKILLLDEATAHLDGPQEELVEAGIQKLQQGRTTLIAAHRLATVRRADEILVLDKGQLVERGTFKELYSKGGAFTALCERQFSLSETNHPKEPCWLSSSAPILTAVEQNEVHNEVSR